MSLDLVLGFICLFYLGAWAIFILNQNYQTEYPVFTHLFSSHIFSLQFWWVGLVQSIDVKYLLCASTVLSIGDIKLIKIKILPSLWPHLVGMRENPFQSIMSSMDKHRRLCRHIVRDAFQLSCELCVHVSLLKVINPKLT